MEFIANFTQSIDPNNYFQDLAKKNSLQVTQYFTQTG